MIYDFSYLLLYIMPKFATKQGFGKRKRKKEFCVKASETHQAQNLEVCEVITLRERLLFCQCYRK